jgi:diguanylate cyclase (GGDEF)-like protein/PAS domain S-box-containing protein
MNAGSRQISARPGARAVRHAALFLLLVLLLPALARATDPVRIGVLAYRSLPETSAAWGPTAAWLEARIPGHRFRIVPLFFEELSSAVASGELSFVITNPHHYVLLHVDNSLSVVATLMPLAGRHPVNRFGGVIFTRNDRRDIQRLGDLRGRRVGAVSAESMGGYLAQHWTLFKAGIDPRRDLHMVFTGMPHENVVRQVLAGELDAGFARTSVLEQSIGKGLIGPAELRVLNRRPEDNFPLALSTDLYPEWAFAALRGVDPALKKAVTLELLSIPPDSEAARRGGYYGFSPPADYADVEAIMVRLDLHPHRRDFGWREVVDRYAIVIISALALVGLGAFLAVNMLRRSNQALNTALREADELARQRSHLLASLGEGVYGTDRLGVCTFINPTALKLLGYDADEILGADPHALFHHGQGDGSDAPHADCPIHRTLQDGMRRDSLESFLRKDGQSIPVRLTVAPIQDGGSIRGAVVAFQDISDETRRTQRLHLLDTALKATDNGVVITDRVGNIEWINPAVTRLSGFAPHEAVGQNARLFHSGTQDQHFYEHLWQTINAGAVWRGDLVNRRKDGSTYSEEMTITPVLDEHGSIQHFVAVKQDITERKRMEGELRQLASTDPLTGIANRRRFLEAMNAELQRIRRYGNGGSLLMLDLDHFKRVNDKHGHAAGDEVLRHFTVLVQRHLRTTDLLGRLGGEEFGVLLTETPHAGAREFAERLRRHVEAEPAPTGRGSIPVTVSIGLTVLTGSDAAPDDVLARADEALYEAKSKGRNRVESVAA